MSKMSLKPLAGIISLSREPDMITLDDDPDEARAKMPCGHVISPDSMADYCRSEVSRGKSRFFCPDPSCGNEWEYYMVRHVAGFTEAEMKEMDVKITERYMMKTKGYQQCPGCSVWCTRADETSNNVQCLNCSRKKGERYDFCWMCLREWQGEGGDTCGHPSCGNTDAQWEYLQRCPLKQVWGVECPSVRACPNCFTLIEHERDCKHMKCSACEHEFCFVCLVAWIKGDELRGGCGFVGAECKPAPRQSIGLSHRTPTPAQNSVQVTPPTAPPIPARRPAAARVQTMPPIPRMSRRACRPTTAQSVDSRQIDQLICESDHNIDHLVELFANIQMQQMTRRSRLSIEHIRTLMRDDVTLESAPLTTDSSPSSGLEWAIESGPENVDSYVTGDELPRLEYGIENSLPDHYAEELLTGGSADRYVASKKSGKSCSIS